MLGVAIATLHAWRRAGKPPAFIRLGRAVRYRLSDLHQLIRQGGYANRPGAASMPPRRAKEMGLPAVNSPVLLDCSEQAGDPSLRTADEVAAPAGPAGRQHPVG
jgi:hypothetical protein